MAERQATKVPSAPTAQDFTESRTTIITSLQNAATTPSYLAFYPSGQTERPESISYKELYQTARHHAASLRALATWRTGQICVVYTDDHRSNITAFWSVILAGGIPAITGPFLPQDARSKLGYLNELFDKPLFLTTQTQLQSGFTASTDLDVVSLASLGDRDFSPNEGSFSGDGTAPPPSTAAIMLTSGSSGNPKAVPLTHEQITHCVNGKMESIPCNPGDTILGWVGMDHVAGLVECHIRGVFRCTNQVCIAASDVVSNPGIFLELLARHKVSSSFAPNFLLAKIVEGFRQNDGQRSALDLTHLRNIASGGEACTTETCRQFSELLKSYGAPENVMVSGFGMTETGAGCIFNVACPRSDLDENYEFASVGKCVTGVEVRITPSHEVEPTGASNYTRSAASMVGNVEIRGPIVFTGYFNNPEANLAAFTPDNWFRTGDMGFIGRNGHLVLTGRGNDLLCINGVKHVPTVQERIIEDAKIPGVSPGYVLCFPSRPPGSPTEQCVIVYQHSYAPDDRNARAEAQRLISKAVLLSIGTRPHVLALPPSTLPKSSLGKLPRSKIRKQFELGTFAKEDAFNAAMVQEATMSTVVPPSNETERKILNMVASALQLDPDTIGVEMSFFNVGLTSIDLIKIRGQICHAFDLPDFSIKNLITRNTVRQLARAVLADSTEAALYQPVVHLKATGPRTPLWLIHPGVGEVLVFVGLSQHMQDRPVFALRARGFEAGEAVFGSIDEVVATYVAAIRAQQPRGPYAIAGYSYGSMLAFQVAQRLEALGEAVPFLGCLNLPPHIKARMAQMSPQNCLTHLAQFLQLVSEDEAAALEAATADLAWPEAVARVLAAADPTRWAELDLTRDGLERWARVAYSLQSLATGYDPAGSVRNLDVFWCQPLAIATRSKREWREVHLAQWRDFARTPPVYHAVDGAHYTMLTPAHVRTFQKTLAKALADRGL